MGYMATLEEQNIENTNTKKNAETNIQCTTEKKSFWGSLFDDSSDTSEEPIIKPSSTQPEEKGFWSSLFGDSSETPKEPTEIEKPKMDEPELEESKEKGFWSSLFGDSSDSSDEQE